MEWWNWESYWRSPQLQIEISCISFRSCKMESIETSNRTVCSSLCHSVCRINFFVSGFYGNTTYFVGLNFQVVTLVVFVHHGRVEKANTWRSKIFRMVRYRGRQCLRNMYQIALLNDLVVCLWCLFISVDHRRMFTEQRVCSKWRIVNGVLQILQNANGDSVSFGKLEHTSGMKLRRKTRIMSI